MTDQQQKNLNIELAKNIVKFESHKNSKFQSVCAIYIGGVAAVETYALDGMEEEVLKEMINEYWSIDKSVGIN